MRRKGKKFEIKIPLRSRKKLEEYVKFMLRQYRLVDAFWFLKVEEKFGLEAAVQINEEIWSRMGGLAARELKERFSIGRGLKGFLQAFKLYPWTLLISHQIRLKRDGVQIRTPYCPPQEARLKQGLGEFPCKNMHMKELTNFTQTIDPSLQVKCKYAPPDPHPQNNWCEWEVKLAPERKC